MATRTYATSRAHGTHLSGPPLGDWAAGDSARDNRGYNGWILLLDLSKTDGGVVTIVPAGNTLTATTNQPIPCGNQLGCVRWATRTLSADATLSGTITVCLRVNNPSQDLGALAAGHLYAYVTNGDTLDERTVLCANLTNATAWTDSDIYRTMTFAISGSVDAFIGDRIVIEFGALCSPATTPPGPNAFTTAWGTTNTLQVAQADATNGASGTRAAWVEFSTDLAFTSSVAPANDACSDAIVIAPASVPYVSPSVDSTASADTSRRVWWSFTPIESGRYIATTFGGNSQTTMTVLTGACGAQSTVASGTAISWVGTSQASVVWDAVAGTPYYLRIQNSFATSGQQAAVTAGNSGGAVVLTLNAYEAPTDNDLFVDCQHIAVYRSGVLINLLSDFYGDTPTGSAIDYTLRPLDDLNGGVHTGLRLYVCLFGTTPFVEILDLTTLNVGEFEIDWIQDPLVGGDNLSTVVFDQSGNIIMGWYGNNYAVIDELADHPTADLRRIDATHADNQTGAPWPLASTYPAAYQNGGTDFAELALDQRTVWYTSGGDLIKRYDLVTDSQLADFATLPPATGPRPGARSVRLLPPGDGSAGLLVAYGNEVLRLNASGTVTQSYVPALTQFAQDLDKVEFSVDGLSFWVSDQLSCYVFHFDLDGTEHAALDTMMPPGQLSGFSVFNGFRAGNPPSDVPGPTVETVALDCPTEVFTITGTNFTEETIVAVTKNGVSVVPVTILSVTTTTLTFSLPSGTTDTGGTYCISVSDGVSAPSTLCGSLDACPTGPCPGVGGLVD